MKKSLVSLVVAAACALPAGAAEAPATAVDAVAACTDVKDPLERLACFDRASAPLARPKSAGPTRNAPAPLPPASPPPRPVTPAPAPSPAPATAPAPVVAQPGAAPAAPAAAPAAAPRAMPSFGEEDLRLKDRQSAPEEPQVLQARIASIRTAGPTWFVTLDNGQVWRHESQQLAGYFRAGDAVTITRGLLGGFQLRKDSGDSKNWARVNRIR